MKNKTNNQSKNIYTLSIATMVIVLTLSYIIFIYKTVVLASDSEINNKKISLLNVIINQKEFDYIEQLSSIDMEKAFSLGYKKNTQDRIAYFNTKDNTEFARR